MQIDEIVYHKVPMSKDDIIEPAKETIYDLIRKARTQALLEGIEANTIILNKNMVKVNSFLTTDGLRGLVEIPSMICGLNAYWTEDELPDGYSFAILEGPKNRLAQFESIGMEPDELRKAAEIYRAIKEKI